MPNQEIKIQRLNLRVRGLSEQSVRSALSSLGPAIKAEMARHPEALKQSRSMHIPNIHLSPIQVRGGVRHLRGAIARSVTHSIISHPDHTQR